jgi:hypothetical protein
MNFAINGGWVLPAVISLACFALLARIAARFVNKATKSRDAKEDRGYFGPGAGTALVFVLVVPLLNYAPQSVVYLYVAAANLCVIWAAVAALISSTGPAVDSRRERAGHKVDAGFPQPSCEQAVPEAS